jgi:hypothetical protein
VAFTQPKASAEARGYGAEHKKLRRWWAPKVATGTVRCWRCGYIIEPGQAWDLGHDDNNRSIYRGPEHRYRTRYCIGNKAAGASKGAKITNARRAGRTTVSNVETSRRW